jgi:hypothetical protein
MKSIGKTQEINPLMFIGFTRDRLSGVTPRWFCIPVHGRWFAYAAWATAPNNEAGNNHKSNDEHGNRLHSLYPLLRIASRMQI